MVENTTQDLQRNSATVKSKGAHGDSAITFSPSAVRDFSWGHASTTVPSLMQAQEVVAPPGGTQTIPVSLPCSGTLELLLHIMCMMTDCSIGPL